jgi:hypothetical protein
MVLAGLIWEDPTHCLVIKHQPDCRIMQISKVCGTSNCKDIHLTGNMKKILELVEEVKTVKYMVPVNEKPGKHVWHVVFEKDRQDSALAAARRLGNKLSDRLHRAFPPKSRLLAEVRHLHGHPARVDEAIIYLQSGHCQSLPASAYMHLTSPNRLL